MRGCVKYILGPDMTLNLTLIYRVHDMALCSRLSFLSFDKDISCLARECTVYHHGTKCRVHSWTMTLTFDLNIKIMFSPWIWVWQNVFAFWHRHSKFWHMSVSPWDNMLCTFLTLVCPWPLTYMLTGVSFHSQFLSCKMLFHLQNKEKQHTRSPCA